MLARPENISKWGEILMGAWNKQKWSKQRENAWKFLILRWWREQNIWHGVDVASTFRPPRPLKIKPEPFVYTPWNQVQVWCNAWWNSGHQPWLLPCFIGITAAWDETDWLHTLNWDIRLIFSDKVHEIAFIYMGANTDVIVWRGWDMV